MRQSWDEFFFDLAKQVSTRSTCIRRQYGAVLVSDKTILTTGFNGAPRGYPHCIELGCARNDAPSGTLHELCRATHAEQNVIANTARIGVNIMGSELYLYPPDVPCPLCAKILINAGVKAIHYKSTDYPGWEISKDYFYKCEVKLYWHG